MRRAGRHLDLNAVRVFVSLYECRSYGDAANQLGLRVRTVRGALTELRLFFSDRLFTLPRWDATACAAQLYTAAKSALSSLDAVVLDSDRV